MGPAASSDQRIDSDAKGASEGQNISENHITSAAHIGHSDEYRSQKSGADAQNTFDRNFFPVHKKQEKRYKKDLQIHKNHGCRNTRIFERFKVKSKMHTQKKAAAGTEKNIFSLKPFQFVTAFDKYYRKQKDAGKKHPVKHQNDRRCRSHPGENRRKGYADRP